jgi:hypothetical protein
MGRIHRYGQEHDCLIFNFVAVNTREGRVLAKLLEISTRRRGDRGRRLEIKDCSGALLRADRQKLGESCEARDQAAALIGEAGGNEAWMQAWPADVPANKCLSLKEADACGRSGKAPDRGSPRAGRGRLRLGEQCRPDREVLQHQVVGAAGEVLAAGPAVRRLLHGACSQYPAGRVRP